MYTNTLPGMCIIVVEVYVNIFAITNIWFHPDLWSMCKITQSAQSIMCKWILSSLEFVMSCHCIRIGLLIFAALVFQ